MTRPWHELLHRLIDGGELNEAETQALADALGDPAVRREAGQWLSLDAQLSNACDPVSEGEIEVWRERLLAKTLLRQAREGASSVEASPPGDASEGQPNASRAAEGWKRRRWLLPALAAAAVLALVVGLWPPGRGRYPQPRADGAYTVAGGGAVRRGATLQTGATAATLDLGGYCHIQLDPNSVARLEGAPRDERIFLDRGGVLCDVAHEAGQFAVATELCTASVKGTRFIVQLRETEGGQQMHRKQALVRVLAGLVLVSGAWGQDVLAAGQEKLVPARPAAATPWSEPLGGLRIRAIAEAGTEYRHGKPLPLTLELQNTADAPIPFARLMRYCHIQLAGPKGKWLGVTSNLPVYPWEERTGSLKPQETIRWRLWFDRLRLGGPWLAAGGTATLRFSVPMQIEEPGKLPRTTYTQPIAIRLKDVPPAVPKPKDVPDKWTPQMDLVWREGGDKSRSSFGIHIDGAGLVTMVRRPSPNDPPKPLPPRGRTEVKLERQRLDKLAKRLRELEVWDLPKIVAQPTSPDMRTYRFSLAFGGTSIVAAYPDTIVRRQPALLALRNEVHALMASAARAKAPRAVSPAIDAAVTGRVRPVELKPDTHTWALYHFNGDYKDSSGNNRHLELSNPHGRLRFADNGLGKGLGKCLHITRTHIEGPYVAGDRKTRLLSSELRYPGTGSWTVECVIFVPKEFGKGAVRIANHISEHLAGNDPFQLGYSAETGGILWRTDQGARRTQISARMSKGVWHHVAGVYDEASDSLKLYIDGELKRETKGGRPQTLPRYHCYVGSDFSGAGGPAYIDELRISTVARGPKDFARILGPASGEF